jgi:sterol desaturase/sphingolipid hydroxylase (fatty acid hydroxylase superfamily)
MSNEPQLPDLVLLALPAFLALTLLEVAISYLQRKESYEIRDTNASLLMGIGNLLAGIPTAIVMLYIWSWFYQFRLFDLGYSWWSFVLVVFADDLTLYCEHRMAHRIRCWWAMHVNHHSSQHFNFSTAVRLPWTDRLSLPWILWLPMILLGFPPLLVFFQRKVSLLYQFWLHTETIGRLPGWIEAVMMTPSHHRVHHAVNPRYLDSNYGAIFVIWDKLFGTFAGEMAEEPCRYGLVKNIGTFNVWQVAFHEWIALAKDLVLARSWRERIVYMFGLPGRSFDGSRQTTDEIRAAWRRQAAAAGMAADAAYEPQAPTGQATA